MIGRRGFIFGLGATLAVIPAARLMKLELPQLFMPSAEIEPITYGGAVSLSRIRDLLLPGLQALMADYDGRSAQWDRVFAQPVPKRRQIVTSRLVIANRSADAH